MKERRWHLVIVTILLLLFELTSKSQKKFETRAQMYAGTNILIYIHGHFGGWKDEK